MKKFTILAATVLVTLLSSCAGSKQLANAGYYPQPNPGYYSQPNPGYNPQPNQTVVEEDPVGELVKQFTAEGYKTQSMAYTMRESISKFRSKLQANENLVEVISEGSGSSSFAAEMSANNAAAIKYATQAGSVVRGGMERDFGSLGTDYDNFHGVYVQNVAKFIMPLMTAEMTFVKKEQGKYFAKIGYLIDEAKASDARRNAFNEALKEQANGQVFGENARKYIDEIVRPEE